MIELLNEKLAEIQDVYPVFGIILFTEANPYVIKCLKDTDYWNALDAISGEYLAIFATRLFWGKLDYPSLPPGVMADMMPVWREPKANKELLSCFDIKDSTHLPLFVLFGANESELFYVTYPIAKDSPEAVYKSLEQVISSVSRHIEQKGVDMDRAQLYKDLSMKLKVLKGKNALQRIIQLIQTFRGVSGV